MDVENDQNQPNLNGVGSMYQCEICPDKSYTRRDGLKRHMLKNHPEHKVVELPTSLSKSTCTYPGCEEQKKNFV